MQSGNQPPQAKPSNNTQSQGAVNGAKAKPQPRPAATRPAQPTDPKAGLFNYLLGNDGQ